MVRNFVTSFGWDTAYFQMSMASDGTEPKHRCGFIGILRFLVLSTEVFL
jgi:hypothetical protein